MSDVYARFGAPDLPPAEIARVERVIKDFSKAAMRERLNGTEALLRFGVEHFSRLAGRTGCSPAAERQSDFCVAKPLSFSYDALSASAPAIVAAPEGKPPPGLPKLVTRRSLVAPASRVAMLREVELLNTLGDLEVAAAADALETQTFVEGAVIFRQDSQGNDCFFALAGEVVGTSQVHALEDGLRVNHKKSPPAIEPAISWSRACSTADVLIRRA